jgi:hypothetical protein
MKTLFTTLALSITSLTSFAQEATVAHESFTSMKTRAQVEAQVLAARDRGERILYGEARPNQMLRGTSLLTREQVTAPVLAARDRGLRLSFGEAGRSPAQIRSAFTAPALGSDRMDRDLAMATMTGTRR